jgi:phage terminase small subunit
VGIPTVEKAPGGLKDPWLGVWRFALKEMQRVGTWAPPLRPFLDEYVVALRTAREHRATAELCPVEENRESGLTHVHAGFASADREMRRAAQLAELLGLTPKAQRALAVKAEEPVEEPDVFAEADELAARRRKTA